jgi:anti-sigma B factor antagonist
VSENGNSGFGVSIRQGADGRARLQLAGDLDLATAASFVNTAREQLSKGPVVLDLSEVGFMDSSGVRALDTLLKECDRNGWSLAVGAQMTENVIQVLELTGMMGALPIEDLS